MLETETTARQQFVEDFLLVAENDYNKYTEFCDLVETYGVSRAGELIQEQFENWVYSLTIGEKNEFNRLILSQLLIGWGSDCFYQIAKRFDKAS